MSQIENLKQEILKEYPRLGIEDKFCFECGPHLECFNVCCSDVNIFLTPYDVLQMRKPLNIDSTSFLAEYTIVPFDKQQKLPVPLMKMRDTESKECHFVDPEKGCTIYQHRPWPCRMYPLGSASPGETEVISKPFYFLMKEEHCKGHNRPKEWKIKEWLDDQVPEAYTEFGELFKRIALHPAFSQGKDLAPQQIDMYWMALYDIDRFRRFIFESTFLQRFDVDQDRLDSIKTDDEELLLFGFDWLRFSLFGEKRMKVKPDAEKWVKGKTT
ncbi:MAG: YkgJ family cysteine cluster protein [Candidatus Hatepunaea meridiana]|nr:YkgJ family cysteine cluster protein [Candidatus Hatepunaea meridiana]